MSGNESQSMYRNQLVRYMLAILRPLIHHADSQDQDTFTLYHLLQEEQGRDLTRGGPGLPALGHAFAGSAASTLAKALVYPINICVTRLQVQRQLRNKGEAENAARDADKEYSSVLDAASKIYNTEGGLRAFYSGCAGDVSKTILDSFLFFLAYNSIRQFELKRQGGKQLSVARDLGVGVVAGSVAKFFSTPIENVVVRQQTAALAAAREPDSNASSSTSVQDIARRIYNERGIAGFWSGYSQAVVLTINPSITFAADNLLTALLPRESRDNPSAATRFLVSALSKVIATTLVYPAMLAKSRAQVSGGLGSDEEADLPEYLEKSDMQSTPERKRVKNTLQKLLSLFTAQYAMLKALRKVYRDEGLSGLYSGLEGEIVKGFLQHGLTMMVKEQVHIGVIQAYYLLLKTTKRWPQELQKAQEGAKGMADEAQKGAKNVTSEAQERASNLGETVSEGAKRLYEKAGGSGSN